MSRRDSLIDLLVFIALAVPTVVVAQHEGHVALPSAFDEPMPLYEKGLGPLQRPVTTGSAEAQAYFNQGLQLLYAFTPEDAARSFREAQRHDPSCAMCYFGEAWAWGPYLNGAMGSDDAPRAYAAIRRAAELAPTSATSVERAMIEAMAVRYTATHDAKTRPKLDSTYARAIGKVWEAHRADLDVAALYAEALMLLEPRRGTWDLSRPAIQHIHRVLEDALARDITHPGACHLYVHATESTVEPGKAEGCANYLGNAIPGASHINHMPSHTFNRVGRWGDAVRANIQAWHSDQKAEYGEGFAIYPSHNLHMLLFAASMDGQGAVAVQAGKDYAKLVNGGAFYQVLALVRFGRFDEVLELTEVPEHPIFRGFWDFGRGYALLRAGERDRAKNHADHVERAAANTPTSFSFRGHSAADLLGVVGGILRGEILRAEGKLAEAIPVVEQAVTLEDGLRYDEPEPLNFSARHWLGALLLEADRPADAERVYREALADHPNNGWSLFGLEQALRAQGKIKEAEAAHAQFELAWARADVWLRASRF